jgi:predicted 2-oxoglutarate/Fe(II)-dependent dioxygenase YbiX
MTGAPAPLFRALSPVNPSFAFSSLGGRYVVLGFLPPPGAERDAALEMVRRHPQLFRDDTCLFFGVLPDRESFDRAQNGGMMRWFADFDGALRRLYEAEGPDGAPIPRWVAIDPSQRILAWTPLDQAEKLFAYLQRLGPPGRHAGVTLNAPVLIVPRVLEPALCRQLIDIYRADGGAPSGVMRERDGRTVGVLDDFKKRRDTTLTDEPLLNSLRNRLHRRLVPEIRKAFQFEATRIERYIVACYDAEEGGYFKAHRDDTTAATAHRKFAVSINLNAEDFEGGNLIFPEFGPQTYRPPTGGAVVFSCSLLHEATPVTAGTRYAFLPFLYDEAGAELKAKNQHLLVSGAEGLIAQPDAAAAN